MSSMDNLRNVIAILEQDRQDIVAAITEKGGTAASEDGYDDFANDIRTIPTGSATISASLTVTPSTTSFAFTLSKKLPIDLTIDIMIGDDPYVGVIPSGSLTGSVSFSSSASSRTASISVSIDAEWTSMFSIYYPSTVTIPAHRNTITLSFEDITSIGCRVVASEAPTSDLTVYVVVGDDVATGVIYTDGTECELTWEESTEDRTCTAYVNPESDSWSDFVCPESIEIPGGAPAIETLSYIQTNGTGYITTDINVTLNTTYVAGFHLPSAPTSLINLFTAGGDMVAQINGGTRRVYGYHHQSSSKRFTEYLTLTTTNFSALGGKYFYFKGIANAAQGQGSFYKSSATEVALEQANVTTRLTTNSSGNRTFTGESIVLMANTTGGNLCPNGTKFTGVKIWEGTTLAHELLPARYSGDYGVVDTITNTFYPATGTFTGA